MFLGRGYALVVVGFLNAKQRMGLYRGPLGASVLLETVYGGET